MRKYKGRLVLTITAAHVSGKAWGGKWTPERSRINECMGSLQPCDIGKQVWESDPQNNPGVYNVESDSQRDARLAELYAPALAFLRSVDDVENFPDKLDASDREKGFLRVATRAHLKSLFSLDEESADIVISIFLKEKGKS